MSIEGEEQTMNSLDELRMINSELHRRCFRGYQDEIMSIGRILSNCELCLDHKDLKYYIGVLERSCIRIGLHCLKDFCSELHECFILNTTPFDEYFQKKVVEEFERARDMMETMWININASPST